jgi:hypothetical protein
MSMANGDQLLERLPRHQAERPAGKFERVDIRAHRFEDVLELTGT